MKRDFNHEAYNKLLDSVLNSGYETITIREYLKDDDLPERFVIHRHDVDSKPKTALRMGEIEKEKGISSTYYFRMNNDTFNPELIQKLESMGHEIGYHYEVLDKAEGDMEKANEIFKKELQKFRKIVNIDTVCMHGNPLSNYDNRDIWNNKSLEEYDLLGEAYLSIDFEEVTYYSDTGRNWIDDKFKVKDHVSADKQNRFQAKTTFDLIDIIESNEINKLCILAHPARWKGSFSKWLIEYIREIIINLGKRFISK